MWSEPGRLTLVALGLVLTCGQPPAPASAQADSPQGFTLRQNVEEVLLYCSVADRKGHLVTDLDRTAFHMAEDKRPVQIGHFTRQEVPVSLSLVLDDSDSMKAKHAALQRGALDILQGSGPDDEVSLTSFADEAKIEQELTPDFAAARQTLSKSTALSGGTALFDTLVSAANHLSEGAHNSKRILVVITDGKDNSSAADLRAAVQRVQRTDGPVIYAVGLLYDLPGADARRARKDLSALADETGGIAFFPGSDAEVHQTAQKVAQDIRNQYMIAFRPFPDAGTGAYHAISVRASSSHLGTLTVRTRKGFVRRTGAAAP